jgi:hypothetical protein
MNFLVLQVKKKIKTPIRMQSRALSEEDAAFCF